MSVERQIHWGGDLATQAGTVLQNKGSYLGYTSLAVTGLLG